MSVVLDLDRYEVAADLSFETSGSFGTIPFGAAPLGSSFDLTPGAEVAAFIAARRRTVPAWLGGTNVAEPMAPLPPAAVPSPPAEPHCPQLTIIRGEGRGGVGQKWRGRAFRSNGGEVYAWLDVNIANAEQGAREKRLRVLATAYIAAADASDKAAQQLLGELVNAEATGDIERTVLDEIWGALQKEDD